LISLTIFFPAGKSSGGLVISPEKERTAENTIN